MVWFGLVWLKGEGEALVMKEGKERRRDAWRAYLPIYTEDERNGPEGRRAKHKGEKGREIANIN